MPLLHQFKILICVGMSGPDPDLHAYSDRLTQHLSLLACFWEVPTLTRWSNVLHKAAATGDQAFVGGASVSAHIGPHDLLCYITMITHKAKGQLNL